MSNERRWTPEEDQFLIENYKELGRHVCAERLGRVGETVYARAHRLGCTKRRRSVARVKIKEAPPVENQPSPAPVAHSDFIRPLSKERLMSGKA